MPLLTEEKVRETKTAEEITKEIMTKVTEDVLITISGTVNENLEALAKYDNRDTIQIRGEKFFEKQKEHLMREVIEKLITDKFKAVKKYLDKKENDAKMQYFLLLRSKGVSLEEAEKMSGINLVSVQ